MRVLSSLQNSFEAFFFISGSSKRGIIINGLGVLCNMSGSFTRISPKLNILEKL